jgi:hypothetical protein
MPWGKALSALLNMLFRRVMRQISERERNIASDIDEFRRMARPPL